MFLPGRGAPAADQEEGPVRAGADVSQQDHQEIRLYVWRQKVSQLLSCTSASTCTCTSTSTCTCTSTSTCTCTCICTCTIHLLLFNVHVHVVPVRLPLQQQVDCTCTCKSHGLTSSPKLNVFVVPATAFTYALFQSLSL